MQGSLSEIGASLTRLSHELELEQAKLQREEEAIQAALAKKALLEEASQIVNSIAEDIQHRAHEHVSQVVTRCLQAVFTDDAYEFKILFERKRGKTEARLVFYRGDLEIDPLKAAGGGPVSVAAFGLRLACLLLSKPRKRRILCLDEPFSNLSRDYLPNLVELLEQLTIELGVQMIIVSHSPELEIGKVIQL